jgi:hypothetical protein
MLMTMKVKLVLLALGVLAVLSVGAVTAIGVVAYAVTSQPSTVQSNVQIDGLGNGRIVFTNHGESDSSGCATVAFTCRSQQPVLEGPHCSRELGPGESQVMTFASANIANQIRQAVIRSGQMFGGGPSWRRVCSMELR